MLNLCLLGLFEVIACVDNLVVCLSFIDEHVVVITEVERERDIENRHRKDLDVGK